MVMHPEDVIDTAEALLKEHDCRIQSFLASGITQYSVKKRKMSISHSFLSIRECCEWVVDNEATLAKEV
jgi:hypothetical protein